jgi:hypothetical protein
MTDLPAITSPPSASSCPLYVAGLIGPGDRKSVQPMAERLAPGDYDQLHHFVAAGVWDAAPLETELLIGEHRASGEKKYYLANLPARIDLRSLVATIKPDGSASRPILRVPPTLPPHKSEAGKSLVGASITRFAISIRRLPTKVMAPRFVRSVSARLTVSVEMAR